MEYTLVYEGCGLQRRGSGPLPPGLVGLDRAAVARAFADAVVVALAPDLLRLRRAVPGCPADTVTLLEREGSVAVVEGRPGDLGRLVQRTDVAVRSLAPEDRLRLERGLVVPAARWSQALAEMRAR